MSDVSQGPGWWLASDGKWYPPHTAPQATLPPDATGAYPQQYPAAAETGAATAEAYAQQGAPAGYPGAYQQPVTYPPGYSYPYGGAAPDTGQAAPVMGGPVVTAPAVTQPAQSAPTAAATSATGAHAAGAHWQPWLALAGVALVLWGLGGAALTWADWRAVQSQLSAFNTVTQGHVGMALGAAGAILAGVATIAIALVLDRR